MRSQICAFMLLCSPSLVNADNVVYKSQKECESKSEYICGYRTCDYVPKGKTFEEVCGKDFQEGWMPGKEHVTKDHCESSGGYWGMLGLFPQEQCNFKANDVGLACRDNSDCEGACIAELTSEQKESVVKKGKAVDVNGQCSEYIIVIGCYPFVVEGKVDNIACID